MFLVMRCSLYELQQFFIVNLQYRNTSYNVNSVKIRTIVFYLLCILYNTNDPSNTIYNITSLLCYVFNNVLLNLWGSTCSGLVVSLKDLKIQESVVSFRGILCLRRRYVSSDWWMIPECDESSAIASSSMFCVICDSRSCNSSETAERSQLSALDFISASVWKRIILASLRKMTFLFSVQCLHF